VAFTGTLSGLDGVYKPAVRRIGGFFRRCFADLIDYGVTICSDVYGHGGFEADVGEGVVVAAGGPVWSERGDGITQIVTDVNVCMQISAAWGMY